jgi:hypothetical protein
MAAAAPPTVSADLFASGIESLGAASSAGSLPKQFVPEQSGIQATLHVAVPVGPLQALPSARPERLLFGALDDPELRLKRAIPLSLSVEESEIVVMWAEVDEFGHGSTMGEALDDLGHTLRELYRSLYAREAQLGPDLQSVKQILGKYIEPRAK